MHPSSSAVADAGENVEGQNVCLPQWFGAQSLRVRLFSPTRTSVWNIGPPKLVADNRFQGAAEKRFDIAGTFAG
jgi:hypothetical protein